jgi:hypothetical protein
VPQKEIWKIDGLVRASSLSELPGETWVEHERSIMSGQIVRNFVKFGKKVLVSDEPVAEIHRPKPYGAV